MYIYSDNREHPAPARGQREVRGERQGVRAEARLTDLRPLISSYHV